MIKKHRVYIYIIRGPVRGGSIDPPRILENIRKEWKIGLLRQIFGILTPLYLIPSVLTPLSEIPNRAFAILHISCYFSELFKLFVKRAKENLHVIIALSPLADTFRSFIAKFPALMGCCTINWMHQWPGTYMNLTQN